MGEGMNDKLNKKKDTFLLDGIQLDDYDSNDDEENKKKAKEKEILDKFIDIKGLSKKTKNLKSFMNENQSAI
jgi:hypothetical protein